MLSTMEADLRWCAPVIPLHTALIIAAFARRECQTPRAKIKNKHSRTLLTNQADPYAQAVAYYGLSAFLVRRRYSSYISCKEDEIRLDECFRIRGTHFIHSSPCRSCWLSHFVFVHKDGPISAFDLWQKLLRLLPGHSSHFFL